MSLTQEEMFYLATGLVDLDSWTGDRDCSRPKQRHAGMSAPLSVVMLMLVDGQVSALSAGHLKWAADPSATPGRNNSCTAASFGGGGHGPGAIGRA